MEDQLTFDIWGGLYTPPLIPAESGGLCWTQIPECVGVTQAKFEFQSPAESAGVHQTTWTPPDSTQTESAGVQRTESAGVQ